MNFGKRETAMYHPTTRVLTVLELLQSHRQISGPKLAERLEVDIRSVRRYITMLQDLGIPIETERGRYGTYRLRPGFKLPPLMAPSPKSTACCLHPCVNACRPSSKRLSSTSSRLIITCPLQEARWSSRLAPPPNRNGVSGCATAQATLKRPNVLSIHMAWSIM